MARSSLTGSLRTKNISKIIIERVATSLATGELQPGERLPSEEEFAARLGVGRSSVREAIKILEAYGVVEIRRADGTYIVDEFHGGMLKPLVFGILLRRGNGRDMLELCERVIGLAVPDMAASPDASAIGAAFSELKDASLEAPDAVASALTQLACACARGVANPLLRELVCEVVLIASYQSAVAIERIFQEDGLSTIYQYGLEFAESILMGDEKLAMRVLRDGGALLLAVTKVD
ncbi:FadR/GntR family transcriptional regulator [Collinsella ihumii]|uniref:FadR/GntR family transcriptional regulator n=1 Tax=Collinsella ihumii TaxID=1720204 RepID=UPI00082C5F94|nr:GntR family transcriptional regulator [Collinsella ihumii]